MKSIMEEASSVIKAIEKGWIEAGKPQEFSVKVFEEATKNFLGMTSKPAKIAIFFDEKGAQPHAKQHRPPQQRPTKEEYARPAQQQARKPQQQPRHERQERPERHERQERNERTERPQRQQQFQQQAEAQPQERRNKDVWTPEMIDAVNSWIRESLAQMDRAGSTFSTDAKNYYLKINFDTPLFEDRDKERTVFRSFAHLLMQSLRNKFKKGLRGYKVILNSPAQ